MAIWDNSIMGGTRAAWARKRENSRDQQATVPGFQHHFGKLWLSAKPCLSRMTPEILFVRPRKRVNVPTGAKP